MDRIMIVELLQTFLIAMIVFVPLEHLLPRDRSKKILRKSWKTDISYALLAGVLISIGSISVVMGGGFLLDYIISDSFRTTVGAQPFILQLIGIIIVIDIVYYWIHRAFHEIPRLWRIHAIHHSIENMDWLASHRVHPIDQVLTRGTSLILPFAMGFDAAAIGVWAIASSWHSLLNHSNINIKFGPLKWFVVSPTFHHWHHANEAHAFDKNFAGQLPILDVIFGTAIMNEKEGPKLYGTHTPVPENFVDQMMVPIKSDPPNLDPAVP